MKKNIVSRSYIFLGFGLIGLILLIEISSRLSASIKNILSSLDASPYVIKNLSSYLSFTLTVLPIFLVEILLPSDDETSKNYKHGVLFWIITFQFNYFFSLLSVGVIKYFGIHPIFDISFEAVSMNSSLNPILLNSLLILASLFIFDFFYYWFHRMQHSVSFFWEFHKTHHSIKNLNSLVSYHHISEELFRIPFITIPLAILIHINVPKLALLSAFVGAYGQFIHMNSKVSLGTFLRLFFSDNFYHRIHHSIEERHYDKNFAAFFPIWDILFKTAVFPEPNQFPEVGVSDMEQPKNIKDYLFSPNIFNKKSKK